LNYTRGGPKSTKSSVPVRSRLPNQADHAPDGDDDADAHQESHPARPVGGICHTFGCLALAVLPPGEPVPDEQCQTETDNQFGEDVVDSKQLGHG